MKFRIICFTLFCHIASAQTTITAPFAVDTIVVPDVWTLELETPPSLSPQRYRAAVVSECESFNSQRVKLQALPKDKIRALAVEMRRLPVQGDMHRDFQAEFAVSDLKSSIASPSKELSLQWAMGEKKPTFDYAADAAGIWYEQLGLGSEELATFNRDRDRLYLHLHGRDLLCDFISGRLKIKIAVIAEVSLRPEAATVRSGFLPRLNRLLEEVLGPDDSQLKKSVRLGLGLYRLFQDFQGRIADEFLSADYILEAVFEKESLVPREWFRQSGSQLNWHRQVIKNVSIHGETL